MDRIEKAIANYKLENEEGVFTLEEAFEANQVYQGKASSEYCHTPTSDLLGKTYFYSNKKFWDIIENCINVYYTTPTIRNIIDLMVDFASEGLKIEHKIESQQTFFENWASKTNFNSIIPEIFHTILLTGNCVVMRQEGRINGADKNRMSKAAFFKEEKVKINSLPINYTILNPKRISFEKSEFFNATTIKYHLTEEDIKLIRNPKTREQKEFVRGLLSKHKNQITSGRYITIDPADVRVLHYKKLGWQNWAIPLIFSAIDDVNYKKMLRRMDESSAADVIKAVILFKLGNMKEGFEPKGSHFRKLAGLLKGVSAAKNIVWNDLISIEDSYPPIEKILGSEKYDEVNREILANFGVSQILVTGEAGNFSSGFLSVRTLQERLETLRNDVLSKFIIPELERVRRAVRFASKPSVRFSSMSLRDEDSEKKLLKELVDRKIISNKSMLEAMGLDSNIEKVRIDKERGSGWKTLSPFDPPPAPKGPTGTPAAKKKKVNGRPSGSGKTQEKKRSTKPRGISVGALEWKDRVQKRISVLLYEWEGEADAQKVDSLTALCLPSLEYTDNLTDEAILSAIVATADRWER